MHLGMVFLFFLPDASLFGQAKTMIIGRSQNQTGQITDWIAAQRTLQANLPSSAVVSDLRIDYAYADSIYYLSGKVANDDVNTIFISLHEVNGQLVAMAGPGSKITCASFDCDVCRDMCNGRPCCKCLSGSGRCDMVSTLTVDL